ncbi:Basic proline-rich protein precursor [Rhodovulum sp. P5]|nr:Basic proline-rich protein precursor [Rhodovulum sp. P5]
MTRWLEAPVFLGLAVLLHLAAVGLRPGNGGSAGGGDGGWPTPRSRPHRPSWRPLSTRGKTRPRRSRRSPHRTRPLRCLTFRTERTRLSKRPRRWPPFPRQAPCPPSRRRTHPPPRPCQPLPSPCRSRKPNRPTPRPSPPPSAGAATRRPRDQGTNSRACGGTATGRGNRGQGACRARRVPGRIDAVRGPRPQPDREMGGRDQGPCRTAQAIPARSGPCRGHRDHRPDRGPRRAPAKRPYRAHLGAPGTRRGRPWRGARRRSLRTGRERADRQQLPLYPADPVCTVKVRGMQPCHSCMTGAVPPWRPR